MSKKKKSHKHKSSKKSKKKQDKPRRSTSSASSSTSESRSSSVSKSPLPKSNPIENPLITTVEHTKRNWFLSQRSESLLVRKSESIYFQAKKTKIAICPSLKKIPLMNPQLRLCGIKKMKNPASINMIMSKLKNWTGKKRKKPE